MKWLCFIFLLVGISACRNPLDRSIFEPMKLEEIKAVIDEDTLFEDTYNYVDELKTTTLKSEADKAKWSELTYERIHDLVKLSLDTGYYKSIAREVQIEWERKYGEYEEKVANASEYWKRFKEDNSLERYVKIELVEIDKDYYSYSLGIKDVHLGFRLTPLNGTVQQMRFSYRIEAKINETKSGRMYSVLDMEWCFMSSPFTKPVIRYWKASYSDEKLLESKTVATLLRDYNLHIEIDKIRINDKNLSEEDLKIPESIKDYWRYEGDELMRSYYIGDVVREVFKTEYVSEDNYIFKKWEESLKAKDSVTYAFLNLRPTPNKNLF